jgi:DNA-directed RNA polymerase specialized sigma24 family protein
LSEAKPSSKLQAALDAMSDPVRAAFMMHLLGETSAEYLSDWLERAGTPVSPSSIRTYRRALRRSGV